ncbi:MAG: hypothetical protein QOG67_3541 [Verrucomicrobiota bacterium]|jgi:hypothetical protein
MRAACCFFIIIETFLGADAPNDFAQIAPADNDAVRVNVTLNADGSRTAYQFDQTHHKATATTTAADGKALGRIIYQMDDAGRFASGLIFGPDKKLLYKSTYKYGTSGRLEEETHLGKDDAVINKIIYSYDTAGRQIGYEVVDASGKLIGRTSPPKPTTSPKAKKTGK